jgi:hypothetical protein
MKKPALLLTIITFFFCYLEWGTGQSSGQSAFLYEGVLEIFSQRENAVENFTHPLILFPLSGIIILLYQAFRPVPSRRWVYIGLALLAILVLLILVAGIFAANWKMIASTLPFLVSAVWVVRSHLGH